MTKERERALRFYEGKSQEIESNKVELKYGFLSIFPRVPPPRPPPPHPRHFILLTFTRYDLKEKSLLSPRNITILYVRET